MATRIDWKRLLAQHHVPYVDSGPSTARDNLYVKCPWCGASDQGFHLGISLLGRGWGCWRDSHHRGKSASRLVAALLRISMRAAAVLVGEEAGDIVDDSDLAATIRNTLGGQEASAARPYPEMPDDFRPIARPGRRREMFLEYLRERGYPGGQAQHVAELYDLRYALTGPFAYRVVLPVRDLDGHLVTLTGRSIVPDASLRYLTLSPDPESKLIKRGMPQAHGPITDYIFNEEYLFATSPRVLVVCEGPFDAIRVDLALREKYPDAAATCLFGKAITSAQLGKLAALSGTCDHKFLMLDPDARFNALGIMDRLSLFGFQFIFLDERWDDPGDSRLPLGVIRRTVLAACA